MLQNGHDLGVFERDSASEEVILRLERDYDATPEEVWRLLTEPGELAKWLHAAVELDPRDGGAIVLRFTNTGTTVHGRVARFDPPRVFSYTWRQPGERDSLVRFELRPTPAGTHLLLTHSQCDGAVASQMAAGWHHHLELLAAQLRDQPTDWDWPRFHALRADYDTRVS